MPLPEKEEATMRPEKKPTQDELIGRIIGADIPEDARAAADQLARSLWTEQEREYGRQKGGEATKEKAKGVRDIWLEELIRLVVDGYDEGNWLHRESLIEGLRSYNQAYNIKGKGGGQVQRSTISRWLTRKVESFVRIEAIARLIARKQKTKP